jgi:O-antigen/teichoic acid export membrane protein
LDVAVFATHRTLVSLLTYVTVVVQGPVLPELTFLWSRQRMDALSSAASTLVRTITAITGIGAGALWVGAHWVYPLWTARVLEVNPTLLGILSLQLVLAAATASATWPLLAANRPQPLVPWSIGRSAVAIVAAVWLAPAYGVLGVAVATLLADVLSGLWVLPRLASRFLGLQPSTLHREIGIGLLFALPLAAGIALTNATGQVWLVAAGTALSLALLGRSLWDHPLSQSLFLRHSTTADAPS